MSTFTNSSGASPSAYVAYAQQRTSDSTDFLLRLGQLAGSLVPPSIEPNFPNGPATPAVSIPTPPANATIVWSAPGLPAPFTETITVEDIMPEPFEEVAPELVFGTVPTFNELAPDAPGVNIDFEIPDLVVSLPSAPQLMSISVSAFDGITLPTLDASEVPELLLDAPTIREYVPGAAYTSGLLTALKERLERAITEGGTGINADVENAIWDRGREREARAAREAITALEKMEGMGFALPPGVYVDARIKIATESEYVNRGLSREVMIKSAELEQENVKTAQTAAVQLESRLMDFANSIEQRIFDSCRYATEAGVSIFNARVQAYAAFLDAFKARINIYEAQIRGEIAKVDVYKAQLGAESVKADINRSLVEQYKVQIEASLSSVEVFKARIGAIQAKADIEKTKIQIFGEQVRAYGAKVNAYTAGVEGFRATIQAQATQQDAFKSRIQGYTARVDAASKLIDARVNAYQGRLEGKKAEYDGFKAAVGAESARVGALAQNNSSLAESYKAQVQGAASYNEVLTKQWQATIEQAARVAEIGVSTAKANAELYITSRTLAVEAAKTGAQVSAQLGAAALNALNWSTAYSRSESDSTSTSSSKSIAESQSISQSTNYNYSL